MRIKAEPQGRPVTIVVLGPEESGMPRLTEDLGKLGFSVVGRASSASAAKSIIERSEPQLVLAHINMSGGGEGVEAMTRIRADFDVPVVYVTDYRDEELLRHAEESEPAGFVRNAPSLLELRAAVETALRAHQSERRLRESEERFRLLFMKDKNAVILVDAETHTHLDVNEAFESMYGYSREEVLGLPATVISAEPDQTTEGLRAGLEPQGVEVPLRYHRKKNGTIFPVEISASPFVLNGRLVACCIIRDITERKRDESLILAQRDLGIGLSATSDLQEAFDLCMTAAMEVSGMETAGLYLMNDSGDLEMVSRKGLSDEFVHRVGLLPGNLPESQLLAEGRSVYFARSFPALSPAITDALKREGYRVSAAIPFMHQGKVVCSLHLASRKTDDVPPRVQRALETAASWLGAAVMRIRAEEEVRRGRETIEGLINATSDGLVLHAPDGRFIIVNQATADRFGFTPEDFVGKPLDSIIPPDIAAGRMELINEVVRTGKSVRSQDRRGGMDLDNKLGPVIDSDGRVQAVAVFSRDITELKKTQDELSESRQVFFAFADNFPGMVFIKDFDSRARFINKLMRSFFRCEDWVGKDPRTLFPPDVSKKVIADDQRALESGPILLEEWIPDKRGVNRLWETRKFAIHRDQGPPLLGGVAIDITTRKEMENALRDSEERFKTIFENAPAIMMAFDGDSRCVMWNKECVNLFGWTLEEMNASECPLSFLFPDSETRRSFMVAASSGPYNAFAEWRPHRKDDSQLHCILAGFRLPDGTVMHLGHDMTERLKAEERIKASLREKEVLLREIHHRVKNNLAVVSSLLGLQSRHAKDEYHQQMFWDSQERIRSMALAHEKLYQAENLAFVNSRDYLGALIAHLFGALGYIGGQIRLEEDLAEVSLDLEIAVTLGFLVNELVTNSIKHAFPDGRSGALRVRFAQLDNSNFELQVSDDGVGIPEGVEIENAGTLGLDLVRIFTKQLRGVISIGRNHGTEITLKFGIEK